MANYMAMTRTNYFKVTDADRLYDVASRIITIDDVDADVYEREEDGEKYYGIFIDSAIGGLLPKEKEENPECLDDFFVEDVYKEIQKILPEGETAVFYEIGHEKMRYFVSCAALISRDGMRFLDFQDIISTAAKELVHNEDLCLIGFDD